MEFLFFFHYQANAIGRSAKTVREFLEKHYTDDLVQSERQTVKLAIRALLEVVQSGAKNIELAVMRRGKPLEVSGEGKGYGRSGEVGVR